MAPKRASPLDEPPTASSSSGEEEASSEEMESSSDGEEDDEPATAPFAAEKKPTAKKPPSAAPTIRPQPKDSVSDSETETDSGSDSEEERPGRNTDSAVKPIASKPMEETPKAKKPKSQPSGMPTKSAIKRSSENNGSVSDSKRAKKGKEAAGDDEMPAAEDDGKKAGDESKKLFQRLWSEDDEIAILQGMAEYAGKNGTIQSKDINAFHDFIKKSVHVDVSNDQLSNKIRRLKERYLKNAGKSKDGQDPKFSKPHDKKLFELSKKIWGTEEANGGIDLTKPNGKDRKNQKEDSGIVPSTKPKAELDPKKARKIEIDQNATSPLSLSEMIRFNKSLGLSGLDKDTIKTGFEFIGASKKAELEDRWQKLQVAELELFVKRVELVKDSSSLIWEAYKSSGSN